MRKYTDIVNETRAVIIDQKLDEQRNEIVAKVFAALSGKSELTPEVIVEAFQSTLNVLGINEVINLAAGRGPSVTGGIRIDSDADDDAAIEGGAEVADTIEAALADHFGPGAFDVAVVGGDALVKRRKGTGNTYNDVIIALAALRGVPAHESIGETYQTKIELDGSVYHIDRKGMSDPDGSAQFIQEALDAKFGPNAFTVNPGDTEYSYITIKWHKKMPGPDSVHSSIITALCEYQNIAGR
jgi:hypothetical protein